MAMARKSHGKEFWSKIAEEKIDWFRSASCILDESNSPMNRYKEKSSGPNAKRLNLALHLCISLSMLFLPYIYVPLLVPYPPLRSI